MTHRRTHIHAVGTDFKNFVSVFINDLLLSTAMISSLFALGIFWHVVQTIPGLIESIGYMYGIFFASFTLDSLYA